MKRNAQFNSGPTASKALRTDSGRETPSNLVRLLVPSRAAGLIIGKGGENIKRIKQKHPAKMYIPEASGAERVFVIDAQDPKTVVEIVGEVIDKIKDLCVGETGGQRYRQQRNDDGLFSEPETMVDLRILVHQSLAGSLIGRGGERIKKLRTTHRMKLIKVYQVCAPRSTDRVLQLISTVDRILSCLNEILDNLKTYQMNGERYDYDANMCDESMAMEYGGWMSPQTQQFYQQQAANLPQPMHQMGPRSQAMLQGAPRPQMMGSPMSQPFQRPPVSQQEFPYHQEAPMQPAGHNQRAQMTHGGQRPPRGGRPVGHFARGGRGGSRGGNKGSRDFNQPGKPQYGRFNPPDMHFPGANPHYDMDRGIFVNESYAGMPPQQTLYH